MDPNPSSSASSAFSLPWLSLAEAVSVQALQGHLARRSPPEVLAQLGQWLAELVRLEQFPLERWPDAIESIDRLAELHQFRLVPPHLEAQRLHKLCESELWLATLAYWKQLDEAYLHCLLRSRSAAGNGHDSPFNLALLVSRLMRNLARQQKNLLLASRPIEQRIWRDLGHAYLLAESWGLADRRCLLTDGRQSDTTPRQEMLKLLMLAMSSPDALTPVQLHVTERLTACLVDHFAFDSQAGPGCCFCFDLTMKLPPRRSPGAAAGTASARQRFFGPGRAIHQLEALAVQLRRRGSLPPEAALGGEFPPTDILVAIRQLERQWADVRPARRDEREVDHTHLTVLPGLLPSIGWLAQMGAGRAPPPSPRNEHWDAIDHSEHGIGARLPDRPPGWLSVGALMAVRPETGKAVRMGVARRITAAKDGGWQVGVELLGQQAQRVTLHPDLPRSGRDGMPAGQAAILLNLPSDRADEAELLLPAGIFETATRLQMQLGPSRYRLESPATISQGRDYRQVRYSLSRQD